jgi:excisionase family DNA binding protein
MTPDRPTDTTTPDLPPTGRLCLSVAEAADAIRVSPRQIYNLAREAGLPTIRLGGRRLIRRADLETWLSAQPVDHPGANEQEPETERAAAPTTARQEKDDAHGRYRTSPA